MNIWTSPRCINWLSQVFKIKIKRCSFCDIGRSHLFPLDLARVKLIGKLVVNLAQQINRVIKDTMRWIKDQDEWNQWHTFPVVQVAINWHQHFNCSTYPFAVRVSAFNVPLITSTNHLDKGKQIKFVSFKLKLLLYWIQMLRLALHSQ